MKKREAHLLWGNVKVSGVCYILLYKIQMGSSREGRPVLLFSWRYYESLPKSEA